MARRCMESTQMYFDITVIQGVLLYFYNFHVLDCVTLLTLQTVSLNDHLLAGSCSTDLKNLIRSQIGGLSRNMNRNRATIAMTLVLRLS